MNSKLIVDPDVRGGIAKQRWSVSDTAGIRRLRVPVRGSSTPG